MRNYIDIVNHNLFENTSASTIRWVKKEGAAFSTNFDAVFEVDGVEYSLNFNGRPDISDHSDMSPKFWFIAQHKGIDLTTPYSAKAIGFAIKAVREFIAKYDPLTVAVCVRDDEPDAHDPMVKLSQRFANEFPQYTLSASDIKRRIYTLFGMTSFVFTKKET